MNYPFPERYSNLSPLGWIILGVCVILACLLCFLRSKKGTLPTVTKVSAISLGLIGILILIISYHIGISAYGVDDQILDATSSQFGQQKGYVYIGGDQNDQGTMFYYLDKENNPISCSFQVKDTSGMKPKIVTHPRGTKNFEVLITCV